MCLRIQVKCRLVTLFLSDSKRVEGCRIVPAEFEPAGPVGRCPVVISCDCHIARLQGTSRVGSHRGTKHQECRLLCELHSKLRVASDECRTDVKRCVQTVRGKEINVFLDDSGAHFNEHLLGRTGKPEKICGRFEPAGIFVRPEDSDFSVLSAECFQPLKTLDAVVKSPGKCAKADIVIRGAFNLTPSAV